MDRFGGKIAVVTGGGTGMGRELVRQLAAEGCHVATCDVAAENVNDTVALAAAESPAGTHLTTFTADVSDEVQMLAFAAAVRNDHATEHINLLFNNAGIRGGGSFVEDPRGEWDRTFAVCWGGVYNACRAFMPMLLRSEEGHVVNTSSLNGFWASLGPNQPPHRVQRSEVRRERLHRSVDHRLPGERATPQGVRCHAWTYRHLDRDQLVPRAWP